MFQKFYKYFQTALPWIPLVLVGAFYIFALLPEKGVSLQDESWFLYSAWAMVTPGIPFDIHNVYATGYFYYSPSMMYILVVAQGSGSRLISTI